jgi:anti-anti-sigma regulatory factor
MLATAQSWSVRIDRGPDWLFARLSAPSDHNGDYSNLAEHLWNVLEQHFVYRLVLEFDELPMLPSALIGQLVLLHKRLHMRNGMLRLCGLTDEQRQALEACRLESRFPHYTNREAAVMGHRPMQPR